MSIWTYLAIALIAMESDALACSVSGLRYRIIASAVWALLWPVSAPCVIVGVFIMQRRAAKASEGKPVDAGSGKAYKGA